MQNINLTNQEKSILTQYHGLGVNQKTLKQLAIDFNCSREHIRFIKNCAIKKILEKIEI